MDELVDNLSKIKIARVDRHVVEKIILLEEEIKKALFNNGELKAAELYLGISRLYFDETDYEHALDHAEKALNYYTSLGLEEEALPCHMHIGKIYFEVGNMHQAMNEYLACLRYYRDHDKVPQTIGTLFDIGEIYLNMQLPEYTISNLEEALDLAAKTGDETLKLSAMIRLGNAHNWAENLEKAEKYLVASYENSGSKGSFENKLMSTGSLAILYRKLKRFDESKKLFDEVIGYTHFPEAKRYVAAILNGAGNLYNEMGQFDLALKILTRAKEFFASETNLPRIAKKTMHQYLAIAYAGMGDFKNAYDEQLKLMEVENELHNRDLTRILQDLQIKYRVEEAQKEKEILLRSARMKEQFLANMSHEIRTPMNAIVGLTNLLVKSELTATQKKYMEAIHQSSENLIVIINDILDFSKIEAGKLDFEKVPFEPARIYSLLIETFRMKAEEKGIDFILESDENIPLCLSGDPFRLTQILNNLVSNALKFTDHGYVKLSCRLREKQGNEYFIEFIVEDTGLGIPRNKLESVFESFTQATADTSRRFGGTGLGLTISRQLVEMQKGKMIAVSEEGSGSTFSFYIPYEAGELIPVGEMKESSPHYLKKKISVLIMEDNSFNQMVVSDTLREELGDVDIDFADNGMIGMEKIKNGHFDLVLMDVQMPEMDGYETTRLIRRMSDRTKSTVPIIALSANAIDTEIQRCLDAGMNDFVSKPFAVEDLVSKVKRYSRI